MKLGKRGKWAAGIGAGLLAIVIFGDPSPKPKPVPPPSYPATEVLQTPTFKAVSGRDVIAMVYNPAVAASDLPDIAREECGTRSFCKIMGWTDSAYQPRGFPMTDREVNAMTFSYSLNRDTGYEQVSWNCDIYKDIDPSGCLANLTGE